MVSSHRILAACALLATVAAPLSAHAARRTELTASTTVVAARTGYVDVFLAKDVSLSPKAEGNPDITLSGRGRLIGAYLSPLTVDQDTYSGVAVYRLPAFAGGKTQVYGSTVPRPSCTPFPHALVPVTADCTYPAPTAIQLTRGNYRLLVVTDGSPVTVRLTLRGLSARRSTIRTARDVFSAQTTLPALDAAGDRMVTFGAVTKVPPTANLDVTVVARGTSAAAPHAYERSACIRRDGATPAPPFAYAPACPGGEAGTVMYASDVSGEQQFGGVWYTAFPVAPNAGEIGVGGSLGDSGGVRLTGALAVLVENTW